MEIMELIGLVDSGAYVDRFGHSITLNTEIPTTRLNEKKTFDEVDEWYLSLPDFVHHALVGARQIVEMLNTYTNFFSIYPEQWAKVEGYLPWANKTTSNNANYQPEPMPIDAIDPQTWLQEQTEKTVAFARVLEHLIPLLSGSFKRVFADDMQAVLDLLDECFPPADMMGTPIQLNDEVQPIIETMREIRKVYAHDERPWVIGLSGGKDSTVVTQLIYRVSASFPVYKCKSVQLISNDTTVETPDFREYITVVIDKINAAGRRDLVPIHAELTQPLLQDRPWSMMIGRGHTNPRPNARYCTDRWKIKPSTAAIRHVFEQNDGAVMCLGVRYDESQTRKASMERHQQQKSLFMSHGTLKGMDVYAPIRNFSVEDVWTSLRTFGLPWSTWQKADGEYYDPDVLDLMNQYKEMNGGECPVVMDVNDHSCGSSARGGCFLCTVVTRNKSLENMVSLPQYAHLQSMVEFRNQLMTWNMIPEIRWTFPRKDMEADRRNEKGQVGPTSLLGRFILLKRLFDLEDRTGLSLITDEELDYIEQNWRADLLVEDRWRDRGYLIPVSPWRAEPIREVRNMPMPDVQLTVEDWRKRGSHKRRIYFDESIGLYETQNGQLELPM